MTTSGPPLPLQDPRERFPKPPFPAQQQPAPGSARDMQPPADHGESSYRGCGRLNGRAALITGGDSGIGRAIAVCFAKEGADSLFTCLPEEQADADKTVKLVESAGRRAIAVPGDIREKSFCKQLVDRTVSEFGRLDILVNNAAFQRTYENLEDISEDDLDATYRTNVYATFLYDPGGVAYDEAGRCRPQQLFDRGLRAKRDAGSLRLHQGCSGQPDQELLHVVHEKRGAGEWSSTRAGVDPSDPIDHARGEGKEVRREHRVPTARSAGRASSHLRVSRVRRCQLRYR
jgi:hypothetical protein